MAAGEGQTWLERGVEIAQRRLEKFRRQIDELPAECRDLSMEIAEELATNLEELSVAMEELSAQNQELLISRQAVEVERQRYQDLFDLAPDGYLVTTESGQIKELNQAAEHLFRKRRQYLLGKPLAVLVAKKDHGLFYTLLDRLRKKAVLPNVELHLQINRTRPPLLVALTVAACRHEGQEERNLRWLMRDISNQKQAQERFRQLQAELVHVARLSALGGMASGLAHELNQPLTAIVSYTQTAQQLLDSGACPPEKLHEALDQVGAQGLRAGEIIRRIRAFARPNESRREAVDINAVIQGLMPLVEWQAQRHQVDIRTDLAEGLPTVSGDVIQIQQVLLNLITNACEAFQDRTGQREIVLRTARAGTAKIETTVTDNGPGITAEIIEQIFNPFFTTKPKGMGIGLDISRSIIEAHGGRLWVTSKPAEGASFRFILPVKAKDR